MYQPRYLAAMVLNMSREFIRLVKLYTTPQKRGWRWHLIGEWNMNDYREGKTFSRTYRLAEYINPRDGYPSIMRDDNGDDIRIKRDLFDQVMDTISSVIKTFWRNIFIENTCTHPHDQVWIEWEGDSDYGYYSQHRCQKCHGYMSDKTEVDRYLPPENRHPDKIKGNPVNPWDRPEAVARRKLEESIEDAVSGDDYGYYGRM